MEGDHPREGVLERIGSRMAEPSKKLDGSRMQINREQSLATESQPQNVHDWVAANVEPGRGFFTTDVIDHQNFSANAAHYSSLLT